MNSVRFSVRWGGYLIPALLMTMTGSSALAGSVAAGSVLSTTAQLRYTIGGQDAIAISAPASVVVQGAPLARITLGSSAVVANGATAVSCKITNAGNQPSDFRVIVIRTQNMDADFVLDANGDDRWQRSESAQVKRLSALPPDKSVSGFLVVRPKSSTASGASGSATILVAPTTNPVAEVSADLSVTFGDTSVHPAFTFRTEEPLNASPTVRDGLVLVGSDSGAVYAVYATGAAAGTLAWRYPTQGGVGAPIRGRLAVDTSGYYFTSNNGWAYHLDRKGREVWKTAVVPAGTVMDAMPLVDDSTVMLACGDGRVRRLDKQSGQVLSESQGLGDGSLTTPAAPRPGELWLGAADGSLYTINDAQGFTVLSAYSVSDKGVLATPYVDVASGLVLSVTPDGKVYAMRIRSSQMAWGPVELGAPVNGAPWVDSLNGIAYFAATDGKLYALLVKDGRSVPGYPVQVAESGGFQNTPVVVPVAGDFPLAFLASDDGKVYGVNTATPELRSVFDTDDSSARFIGSPAVSGVRPDDVLVATASNGVLYGFYIGDMAP